MSPPMVISPGNVFMNTTHCVGIRGSVVSRCLVQCRAASSRIGIASRTAKCCARCHDDDCDASHDEHEPHFYVRGAGGCGLGLSTATNDDIILHRAGDVDAETERGLAHDWKTNEPPEMKASAVRMMQHDECRAVRRYAE